MVQDHHGGCRAAAILKGSARNDDQQEADRKSGPIGAGNTLSTTEVQALTPAQAKGLAAAALSP